MHKFDTVLKPLGVVQPFLPFNQGVKRSRAFTDNWQPAFLFDVTMESSIYVNYHLCSLPIQLKASSFTT